MLLRVSAWAALAASVSTATANRIDYALCTSLTMAGLTNLDLVGCQPMAPLVPMNHSFKAETCAALYHGGLTNLEHLGCERSILHRRLRDGKNNSIFNTGGNVTPATHGSGAGRPPLRKMVRRQRVPAANAAAPGVVERCEKKKHMPKTESNVKVRQPNHEKPKHDHEPKKPKHEPKEPKHEPKEPKHEPKEPKPQPKEPKQPKHDPWAEPPKHDPPTEPKPDPPAHDPKPVPGDGDAGEGDDNDDDEDAPAPAPECSASRVCEIVQNGAININLMGCENMSDELDDAFEEGQGQCNKSTCEVLQKGLINMNLFGCM